MRLMIAGYVEGYDKLILEGQRDVVRRAYSRVEGKLPGSLVLEDEGAIIMQIATSGANVDVGAVMTSMGSIINSMFGKVMDYLETSNEDYLREVLELDDQVDKLYFLALRTVKKSSFMNPRGAIDDTIVVKNMEHIADSLDRLSNSLMGTRISNECRSSMASRLKQLWEYAATSINAYREGNVENALKVILNRENMLRLFGNIECGDLRGLMHEGQLIVALSTDICEAAFSKHVRRLR
jgi:phosphate uptake regulator